MDTDFDGSAETWSPNVAPRGGTAVDRVTDTIVLNGVLDSVGGWGNILWPPSAPIL